MRDSSWEEIEKQYKSGGITEEQYYSYVEIKNLSSEDWANIKQDYNNGEITEEQYNLMLKIREMPKDWKTASNALNGLGMGIASGVWEGMQWYLGRKLGNITTISNSQKAASTMRVGVDTVFNGFDTPFRAFIDALASDDKDFKEAFAEQGGLSSVLINTFIGLAGSIGGEIFNGRTTEIKVNSMEDLPSDLSSIINNKDNVNININGKTYSYFDLSNNEVSLKNSILSKVSSIDDEVLKAKTLYDELNKKVHYDLNYPKGNAATQEAILRDVVTFDNMNADGLLVCKGWSELYSELLKEQGIDCKIIKANKAKHWWVEIYTKDGRTFTADATERINGSVDLINSKIGSMSNGFFEIGDNQIGERPSKITKTQKQIDQIIEIDKTLGYANENGYFLDNIEESKKLFDSSIFDRFRKGSDVKRMAELITIPEGLDGYDAFGYFLQLQRIHPNISSKLLYLKTAKGIEGVCYTTIGSEISTVYQLHSATLGTVRFSNLEDFMNYMDNLDIS